MTDTRIAVMLVTGFLGSGKTTLLNRLIGAPGFERCALIVNELGEIAVDHLLVAQPAEQMLVLDNGCVCCSARGDLAGALRTLARGRASADLPAFERVLIETTGVADPVPLMETLCEDEAVAALFRPHGIVTTMDAINGCEQMRTYAESVKQVAAADRVLVTKCDLASSAQCDAVQARVRSLNPGAAVVPLTRGSVSSTDVLGELWRTDGDETFAWIARAQRIASEHVGAAGTHLARPGVLRTFSLWHTEPVTRAGLVLWLDKLAGLKAAELLRVKGVLNVEGMPVAVHAVQRIVHEPVFLPRWPDAERRSRLVFITHGLPPAAIEPTLEVLGFVVRPRSDRLIDAVEYQRFVAASARLR